MKTANNGQLEDEEKDAALKELRDIKGLLALLLLKGGAKQTEIAKALGVGQATISRNYGFGEVESFIVEAVINRDQDE